MNFLMGEICDECEIKLNLSQILMFFKEKFHHFGRRFEHFFHHNKFVCVGIG